GHGQTREIASPHRQVPSRIERPGPDNSYRGRYVPKLLRRRSFVSPGVRRQNDRTPAILLEMHGKGERPLQTTTGGARRVVVRDEQGGSSSFTHRGGAGKSFRRVPLRPAAHGLGFGHAVTGVGKEPIAHKRAKSC